MQNIFAAPQAEVQPIALVGPMASAGVVSSTLNPNQIAILHWYSAGQTANFSSGGFGAIGVAFDGANIWVANNNSNVVTKMRANDGEQLATFTAGNSPYGVVFDGAYIWVTNYGDNNVYGWAARDQPPITPFVCPVGKSPLGLAFDRYLHRGEKSCGRGL